MWINLDDEKVEILRSLFPEMAKGERKDAALFWNDAVEGAKEAREICLARAVHYDALAETIEERLKEAAIFNPYRAVAQEKATDELEIDDDAIVSEGGDPGAWVHAWIWITDGEAGVDRDEETCDECDEPLDEAGDGYDGKCADCADKEAAKEDAA